MALEKLILFLADDDEDDRLMFQEAIDEVKIQTELITFHNGKALMDALAKKDCRQPHMIFLDLNMPVKNGMQCLKEIKMMPALADLPIAIYSTSSSEEDIDATFHHGANIYINKPNTFGQLKQVVEKVLQLNWQYQTSNLNRDTFLFRI